MPGESVPLQASARKGFADLAELDLGASVIDAPRMFPVRIATQQDCYREKSFEEGI